MKNITIYLTIIFCLWLCSCQHYLKEGYTTPIKTDKSSLSFSAEGGEGTVTATNHSIWWVVDVKELVWADNEWQILYTTLTETPDGTVSLSKDRTLLEGEWFHISVPDKPNHNKAIVKVDKNNTGNARKISFVMTVGNTNTSISVTQSGN